MRSPRLGLVICCVCAVLFVGSAAHAPAQTIWIGGGVNGDWNNPSNWTPGTPASSPTTQLLFATANNLATSQNIANPFDLNSLTFDVSAGAFSIGSGALRFQANGATGPQLLINTAAPITITSPVTFNATGSIGGTGSGTLTFGPLTVAQGTLSVDRSGVSTGNLTVNAGATISPGSTPTLRTLTIGSAATPATVAFGGTYAADIGAGTSSDLLAITGALNLAGTSALTISGTPSGGTYTLATYTTHTGTFNTVNNLPANYQLSYGATSLQLVPVPEPALILALCAAGAGVVGWRRRDSRSRPGAIS